MSTTVEAATRDHERQIGRNRAGLGQGASTLPVQVDVGLTFLRVIAGILFIAHGAQKLFSFGIPGVVEAFSASGVPLPGITAPAVTLVELLGGIALLVGLFTPIVSIALAIVMLGAIVLVHLPSGLFAPDGFEYPLTLLAAMVPFVFAGAGRYSVDALLARRRSAG